MSARFWIPLVILTFLAGLTFGVLWNEVDHPKPVSSEHECRSEAWEQYIAGILRDVLETNPAWRRIIEARVVPLPPVGLAC